MITEKKTEPTVTTPEVNVQKTKDMENINIVCSKHGIINNLQPRIWMNYGSILVKGGYWNGNIILQNFLEYY